MPSLASLYEQTFRAPAKSMVLTLTPWMGNQWELRIDDPSTISTFEEVSGLVVNWRSRFPFLKKWIFQRAERAWGNSILFFTNRLLIDNEAELDPLRFYQNEKGFLPALAPRTAEPTELIDILDLLEPLGGPISGWPVAIAPLENNTYLNVYSLHYMALFLLSSLVRYRPNVWVHAISRSVSDVMPADDSALAVIETLLDHNSTEIPTLVAEVLGSETAR